MKLRNVSFRELAARMGMSETGVRKWFSADYHAPYLTSIEKISVALEVHPFELFCDRGDVAIPLTEEKKVLLDKYDNLTPKQKAAIMILLDSYLE